MKLGAPRRQDRVLLASNTIERTFKSLLVQLSLLLASAICYMRTGYIAFWMFMLYFLASACFVLFIVLVKISYTTRRNRVQKDSKDKVVVEKVKERMFYAPQEQKKAEDACTKKEDIDYSVYIKKKKKQASIPSKLAVRKYNEYKNMFQLSKELEKAFKNWMYSNIVCKSVTQQYIMQNEYMAKQLTQNEFEVINMIANNGFMCYDKKDYMHNKALYKILYNYFNIMIPSRDSYYNNPMDEFVCSDINRIKISMFGLLVEDTEVLLERKKMLNIYFMNKTVLYDTEGDVVLAFLLLLIFAKNNTGTCLGSLSLRNLKFLPVCSTKDEYNTV